MNYDESYVASDDLVSKRSLAGHIDGHLPLKEPCFRLVKSENDETRPASLKLLSTLLSRDVRGAHHVLGGGNSNIVLFSPLLGEDSHFD